MPPLPPWSPLVEGEAAGQALAAAEAIARDLAGDPESAPGLHLSGGRPGVALFCHYLEKSLGHAEAGELAQYHAERAIAELGEQPAPSAGLYHGFTGVAWVVEHLAAGEQEGDEEDLNREIDEALLSLLRQGPWQGSAGLLSGPVGFGVYALERLPRPSAVAMLPLIVARLAERPERETDRGMAHGAAGVIALLARVLQEGEAGPQAASLLAGTVDGVLASSLQEEEGDLAWCAGDAGLSAALLAAARACGRDDWEAAARRLAAAAAERHAGGHGEGFDPALCHGTAGLSHLFHRLFQATGDSGLLAAARRWLERTLAQRRPGEGIGGYLCRGGAPGFLGGAAGIGLALLAAATPVEPEWDRLLLLSGRAPRAPGSLDSCQEPC